MTLTIEDLNIFPRPYLPTLFWMAENANEFLLIEEGELRWDGEKLHALGSRVPQHINSEHFYSLFHAMNKAIQIDFVRDSSFGSVRLIRALFRTIQEGKKVISPTYEQAFKLSEVEARIKTEDFQMPFPSMIVEIPKGYCDAMSKRFNRHCPHYLLISKEEAHLTIVAAMDAEFQYSIQAKFGNFKTMEDLLSVKEDAGGEYDDNGERTMIHSLYRIAINTMILMVYSGVVEEVKKPSLSELKALLKIKKTRKRGKNATDKSYQRALATVGSRTKQYRFCEQNLPLFTAKEVNVYQEDEVEDEGQEKRGSGNNKPHWRKAHFRYVACGKNWSERKLTFIERFFVGAKNFQGRMSETAVNFKD